MTTKPTGDRAPAALRRALASLRIEEAHVEIVDECVHLHGVAPCWEQKRLAGAMAEQATGLPVRNEIRVAIAGFAEDERIQQAVARELARLPGDFAGSVAVEVREGVVRLSGTVRDPREREAVVRAAEGAECVARVEDGLTVAGESLPDRDVAAALAAYVERTVNLAAGSIAVEFDAGVALLVGTVASEGQREAIEELVRWHDGVRDVVNRLRVAPASGVRAGARRTS